MTLYRFRNFVLDPRKMTLRKSGEIQSIEPQVYALIALLVKHHDRTVTKDEIRKAVWGGRIVADSTFNSRIRSVRKVLGNNRDGGSLIKTIPQVGYSFTGEVNVIDEQTVAPTPAERPTPVLNTPRLIAWSNPRHLLLAVPAALLIIALAVGLYPATSDQVTVSAQQSILPNAQTLTPAFQAYLRGKALAEKHHEDSLVLSIEQYDIAIANQPSLALAFAGKAHAIFKLYSQQDLRDAALRDDMYANLNTALELEPNSSVVLLTAAEIALFHERLQEALSYSNQAIQLDPHDANALTIKARILDYLGRTQEALNTYTKALASDPLSAGILNDLSYAQQQHGNISEAYATAMLNVKWNPESLDALDMASHLAWNQGDYAEAHRLLVNALSINSNVNFAITDLIFMYDDIDMKEEAPKVARSEVDRALVAAINGDRQPGYRILNGEPARTNDVEALSYLVEDYESASRVRQKPFHALAAANAQFVQPGLGFWFVEGCYIFRKVNDPIAEPVCAAVRDYYQNYRAKRFELSSDLLGGMGWHLINGDQEQALEWLDELIDRNHAFVNLTRQPLFSVLQHNSAYVPRLERMQVNAAKHREAIRRLIRNDNKPLISKHSRSDGA